MFIVQDGKQYAVFFFASTSLKAYLESLESFFYGGEDADKRKSISDLDWSGFAGGNIIPQKRENYAIFGIYYFGFFLNNNNNQKLAELFFLEEKWGKNPKASPLWPPRWIYYNLPKWGQSHIKVSSWAFFSHHYSWPQKISRDTLSLFENWEVISVHKIHFTDKMTFAQPNQEIKEGELRKLLTSWL